MQEGQDHSVSWQIEAKEFPKICVCVCLYVSVCVCVCVFSLIILTCKVTVWLFVVI